MRTAALCVVLAACGGEEPEPFGIDPPDPGTGEQIHVGPAELEPGVDKTVCQGHEWPGGESLISSVELLARPSLRSIEVYLLDGPADPSAVDCPGLPVSVMGSLAKPIRMAYYSDSETDSFTFPGGVAVSFENKQPLLLRYHYQTPPEGADADGGTEAKEGRDELDIFLNFRTVTEATVVAPFTFSIDTITVWPLSNTEIQTTCYFESARKFVTVAGHQHGYILDGYPVGAGTGVTVSHEGEVLLSGSAGPWAVLGPLSIPRDGGLTFACSYLNNTTETIEHGTGPYDEMCRVFGWVYPSGGPLMATASPVDGRLVCEVTETVD